MRRSFQRVSGLVVTIPSLLLLLTIAEAQGRRTVKRLQFARGADSAIVSGTITKDEQVIYQLDARKGQTMRLTLNGKAKNNDVVLAGIQGPDGKALADDLDTRWYGKLPKTGTYSIALGLIESKSGSYTLEVVIE